MAKNLKTFQTSLGFFIWIAAPSMKAAVESLGRGRQALPSGRRKGKR
jgi:hypothetical protein